MQIMKPLLHENLTENPQKQGSTLQSFNEWTTVDLHRSMQALITLIYIEREKK